MRLRRVKLQSAAKSWRTPFLHGRSLLRRVSHRRATNLGAGRAESVVRRTAQRAESDARRAECVARCAESAARRAESAVRRAKSAARRAERAVR